MSHIIIKKMEQTNETSMKKLIAQGLKEYPGATNEILAVYAIRVSKTWQHKGYNEALITISKERNK